MVALVHVCNLLSTLALRSHSQLDTGKVHAILSSTEMFGNSSLHTSFMAAAHFAGRLSECCFEYCFNGWFLDSGKPTVTQTVC